MIRKVREPAGARVPQRAPGSPSGRPGPTAGARAPQRATGPPQTGYATGAGAPNFSIRIAVALNSAVPDFGSVASIVRRFTSTSSG